MRASGSGPMGVLLMLAPLIVVPVLAIVGIPQFAPVVASPAGADESNRAGEARQPDVGLGESARYSADDLFAPLPGTKGAREPSRDDFAASADAGFAEFDGMGRTLAPPAARAPAGQLADWAPPAAALQGWEVEAAPQDSPAAPPQVALQNPRRSRSASLPAEEPPFAREPAAESSRMRGTPRAEPRQPPKRRAANADIASANPFESAANPFEESARPQTPPARDFPKEGSLAGAQTGAPRTPAVQTGFGSVPDPIEPHRPKGKPAKPAAELEETASAEPVDASQFESSPEPVANSSAAGALSQLTWQAATQQLKALGIQKHHFTYIEERDTFLFTCSLAPRGKAGAARRFEAEADEPLLAVRDVLQQIEQARAGR